MCSTCACTVSAQQSQATGLLAKASQLLARRNTLYVTNVLDSICTAKPNSEDDAFLYLDPKVRTSNPTNPITHASKRGLG
jgi:hypothetical protein